MTRKGNHRTTKAQELARKQKAAELSAQGLKPGEIAAETGASRMTIWRDLKGLMANVQAKLPEEFLALRREQDAVLRKMEELLLTEQADPELVREWRAVRKDMAELWGLNAPTKSITAHVDAPGRHHELLEHSHGLTDEQLQLVYEFMDSLPRQKAEITFEGFGQKRLES
jgi:hypothetical protein